MSEVKKGFDVASLIYRAILESDKSTGKILEDNLDKMVVIPEELWAKTLKLANIEDDRAKFFKEKHDEDHLKLEKIKILIENFPTMKDARYDTGTENGLYLICADSLKAIKELVQAMEK